MTSTTVLRFLRHAAGLSLVFVLAGCAILRPSEKEYPWDGYVWRMHVPLGLSNEHGAADDRMDMTNTALDLTSGHKFIRLRVVGMRLERHWRLSPMLDEVIMRAVVGPEALAAKLEKDSFVEVWVPKGKPYLLSENRIPIILRVLCKSKDKECTDNLLKPENGGRVAGYPVRVEDDAVRAEARRQLDELRRMYREQQAASTR